MKSIKRVTLDRHFGIDHEQVLVYMNIGRAYLPSCHAHVTATKRKTSDLVLAISMYCSSLKSEACWFHKATRIVSLQDIITK